MVARPGGGTSGVTIPAWEAFAAAPRPCRICLFRAQCERKCIRACSRRSRQLAAEGEVLIGNFGTYGKLISRSP